jgi:hypothetical protein
MICWFTLFDSLKSSLSLKLFHKFRMTVHSKSPNDIIPNKGIGTSAPPFCNFITKITKLQKFCKNIFFAEILQNYRFCKNITIHELPNFDG